RHAGRAARQPHRGRRRGGRRLSVRRGVEGDLLLHPVHPGARLPARRPIWSTRRRNSGRLMRALLQSRRGAAVFFGLAALTPLVIRDAYFLDSLVLILLWGALSAAWNVARRYAGGVSRGRASLLGMGPSWGAWMVPPFGRGRGLGMLVGVAISIGAGLIIGFLSNRLKGPYFALSTIAFSQVLLIGVSRW